MAVETEVVTKAARRRFTARMKVTRTRASEP